MRAHQSDKTISIMHIRLQDLSGTF